jgi:hypothetical protein
MIRNEIEKKIFKKYSKQINFTQKSGD